MDDPAHIIIKEEPTLATTPVSDPVGVEPQPHDDAAAAIAPPSTPIARAAIASGKVASAPELFTAGVPTIAQRFAILIRPVETLRALDERAGWLVPWLMIAACGLLVGVVAIARIDFRSLIHQQMEQSGQHVPPEAMEMAERWGAFSAKLMLIVVPIFGSLFGAIAVAAMLLGSSWALGGKRDFLRALVVAIHVNLVSIVRDAAVLIGFAAGNPMPQTCLANLAEPKRAILAAWALSWIDPIYWWWVALLWLGLEHTLGVERRRAAIAAIVIALVPIIIHLGLVGIGVAFSGGRS